MTDQELDTLMRRVLLDSLKLDLEGAAGNEVPFEPTAKYQRQMTAMLADPLKWARKRARSVSETKENGVRSRRRGVRILLLAAIIIVLLSITALAVSGVLAGILDMFREETNGRLSQEQEALIQEDIVVSGQVEIINGVSITLNEVYGDGTNFWFDLSVDGPQVKNLEKIQFEKKILILEGEGDDHSEGTTVKTLNDENPNDEHKEIIIKIARSLDPAVMTQETIVGSLKLVNLIDLTNIDQEILEQRGIFEAAETVAGGEWEFHFQINNNGTYQEMKVSGITLDGNAALNKVCMATAEVESVTLRLLGMEMKYRTDPENATLEFEDPVIVLEDGSEIVLLEEYGGFVAEADGKNTGKRYVTYVSEGPIMLEKVTAIRYGEQIIPWKPLD